MDAACTQMQDRQATIGARPTPVVLPAVARVELGGSARKYAAGRSPDAFNQRQFQVLETYFPFVVLSHTTITRAHHSCAVLPCRFQETIAHLGRHDGGENCIRNAGRGVDEAPLSGHGN